MNIARSARQRSVTATQIFLFLGIASSPLYLFPAGYPQIGHVFLLVLAGLVVLRPIITVTADFWLAALFYVATLRTGVDVLFGTGDVEQLIDIAFILFTIVTFVMVRQMALNPANDWIFRFGLAAAVLLAFMAIVVTGDYALTGDIDRAIGSFNNPNQLAYFSVLATAMLALLWFVGQIRESWLLPGLLITTFLSLVALSKSGMIAQYVTLAIVGHGYLRDKLGGVPAMAMVTIGFMILSTFLFGGYFDDWAFTQRITDIGGQGDDGLEARGYLIAFNGSAADLLFGVSPAGADRILDHEIHSTIFSFLGKYGIIGLVLICGFLVDWALKLLRAFGFWRTLALTVGFLLYGVAHNGSRFSMFWILAATSYAYSLRILAARRPAPVGRSAHA